MDETKVRYEVSGRVAMITLNRPDRLNAMDADVFGLLEALAARATEDPEVRAILVRGEGRSFSSGLDVSLFGGQQDGAIPDIAALQRSLSAYEECPKPTIAAVQGHCLGGGLQLAIACDLRIAATGSVFSAAEIRWGIIPDLGGTQRLPRIIGLGRAKEMVLSGRDVRAEEAGIWGLVNSVVDPKALDEESMLLAARLAAGPPLAIAAAKRLTAQALDHPVHEGLQREVSEQKSLLGSDDFREAVTAGFERRTPNYTGR